MTKKEKLRIYNECIHEIGLLKNGDSVGFCHYQKPWDSKPLSVEKEHDYYCVDGYIMRDFKQIVAIACRHCLNETK